MCRSFRWLRSPSFFVWLHQCTTLWSGILTKFDGYRSFHGIFYLWLAPADPLRHWPRQYTSSSCVWNLIAKRNRSLGTCSEATHELLHLHQHQSSHEDHLVYGIGGTLWWCDLLSAGLHRSRRLDSWISPISTLSALKRPIPVRSILGLTQACCGRSDPGLLLDGEVVYSCSRLVDGCHSTDHILAIQWVFVSLVRVVDRRSFPLVAKGCQKFSLGCVSFLGDDVMEEVIWVHGTAGQCQTCCSPTKLCWWDACKYR